MVSIEDSISHANVTYKGRIKPTKRFLLCRSNGEASNGLKPMIPVIRPHHAGFGMWQAGEANGEGWVDEQDLIEEIASNVYELVELGGPLPVASEIEDIRGRIYGEPSRVFAIRRTDTEPGDIEYVGIVER
jgi:hypothetical protein